MEYYLYQVDIYLLRVLNVEWASPTMDQFWLLITSLHKQPLVAYVFLPMVVVSLFSIYKWNALKPLIAAGLAVALSDLLAYRVVKSLINRPRPFQNPEISDWLRKVGQAHGPSFPSNHAANCFAAALVLSWYFPQLRKFLYTFAGLVALSRVALGVHYPSDVLGGIILGSLVGFLVTSMVLNQIHWFRDLVPVSKKDSKSTNWRLRSRRLADD